MELSRRAREPKRNKGRFGTAIIMKEIDFLPEWYKSGRRQQISYRTQCVALGGIFAVMMVWNFVTSYSISKTEAGLIQEASRQTEAKSASQEFAGIKNRLTRLQRKASILEEIDSKIDVTNVLAEMSFLIDEKIILSEVEFSAEKFVDGRESKLRSGSTVRAAWGNSGNKEAAMPCDVRFKVVISGIAADARDVAELICRLEDSPYFRLVYPSFSRNKKIKAGPEFAGKSYQVSEFEISCYLANYKIQYTQ